MRLCLFASVMIFATALGARAEVAWLGEQMQCGAALAVADIIAGRCAGGTGSRELLPAIESLYNHEFSTVLGLIAFDAKGDLTTQSTVSYVREGGEYVPVE
jgi:hypothetical protein